MADPEAPISVPTRRWWSLLLALVLFAVTWFAPIPLPPEQHRLLAVFLAVVTLWITEALPIAATALLIAPLLVAAGVCGKQDAFAPYADPVLFVFIGGFMIARAMTRHGLDRRMALSILSLPAVGRIPSRVRMAMVFCGAVLSMWISNVATTAILLPILLGMVPADETNGVTRKATAGSLLAIAYGNSLGGLGTPFGTPPNLIALRFLWEKDIAFSFFDWVAVALPTVTVMLLVMLWLLQRQYPATDVGNAIIERPQSSLSRGEKAAAAAFAVAVVGWMGPAVLRALGLELGDTLSKALPAGAVAILAASLLFFLRDDHGALVLPWQEANKIDWGIVMLFGGGLSLGRQMFDTGLAATLSRAFVELSGVEDIWTFTFLVTVFTIVFTETCSNTATSNMLAPLVIAASEELQFSPVPAILAMALAASCAFMLPIATGPNAMVYGTGKVSQGQMMRSGVWLNLIAALVIFLMLRVLLPLYGWVR